MTDQRTYPSGVPCWVDTEQPDVDAARRFYEGLFGWTFQDAMPADAPARYLIASLDGKDVAAIGSAEVDAGAEWNTYIAVDDADATAAAVRAAGGPITREAVDVGPAGRLARSQMTSDNPIMPIPKSSALDGSGVGMGAGVKLLSVTAIFPL